MNFDKPTKSTLLNYNKISLFGIEIAFVELSDYYRIIEEGLISEKNSRFDNFNKKYKNTITSINEPGYENYLDSELANEYVKLDYYFPHNFRASFLIQIFSFIEYELKQICNNHHYRLQTDISIADLKGSSDLDKAKIYLTKVCKVNFNNLQPEWGYLNSIRKIRNRLVHHQGAIAHDDPDRKAIVSFIKINDDISFKEDAFGRKNANNEDITIMITGKGFNENFLANAENFFLKLLQVEAKNLLK